MKGLIVNAGPMLVRKHSNLFLNTFWMHQLDGADPKLLSCENRAYLNVNAGKLDFIINIILCV